MKTRRQLLKDREYLISGIQLSILNMIEGYMKKKNINQSELANELSVTKGYISQILNASYDHKISKMVDLALACNQMPLIYFVDMDEFIRNDAKNKVYDIFPISRPKNVSRVPHKSTAKPPGL